MIVSELIKHLKTLDQNLVVWYCYGDYDHFFRATVNEARQYTLADEEGNNEFEVCLLGEAPRTSIKTSDGAPTRTTSKPGACTG
jgi:hypothetical protein